MRKFRLHWGGNMAPQDVQGYDIADAMNRAGIGRGALRALDCWEELPEERAAIQEEEP